MHFEVRQFFCRASARVCFASKHLACSATVAPLPWPRPAAAPTGLPGCMHRVAVQPGPLTALAEVLPAGRQLIRSGQAETRVVELKAWAWRTTTGTMPQRQGADVVPVLTREAALTEGRRRCLRRGTTHSAAVFKKMCLLCAWLQLARQNVSCAIAPPPPQHAQQV
jgi:hypothetical protein